MKNEQFQAKTFELGFGAFPSVLRLLYLLPFLTGSTDLISGARFAQWGGANLPDQVITGLGFNNEIYFWGAIWFGYGVALWWVSSHLRFETVTFRILMGTFFFSGLGWPDPYPCCRTDGPAHGSRGQ